MSSIMELTKQDSLAEQSIEKAEIHYSENGKTKAILKSPIIEQYNNIAEPYMEFPKGIEILFYDSIGALSGRITADYAVRNNLKALITAKRNVHIFDYKKNRELITEILYWNQEDKRIYNYHFTTLKEKTQVMQGDSLLFSENLNTLELKQIRATIDYKETEE